jgi:hypothetical protein
MKLMLQAAYFAPDSADLVKSNFSVPTAKKRCRHGPGSVNLLKIPSRSNDITATAPDPKSYTNYIVKILMFMYMYLPPACFENVFEFVSGFEGGYSGDFSKNLKIGRVIEGKIFLHREL